MSNIIQSLWVGGELSKMEQLCAKSFVDNGHTYHLYTYGDVKNIPEGVIIKDGNEIVDKSEIFRYKNGSFSAFSNPAMIARKKGITFGSCFFSGNLFGSDKSGIVL